MQDNPRFIANNYGKNFVNQNPGDKLGRLIFTRPVREIQVIPQSNLVAMQIKCIKKQAYLYPVWTDSQGPEVYNGWTWEDDDDRIKPEELWR